MAPRRRPRRGETVDAYTRSEDDEGGVYYSGDDSEIESEEDLDLTAREYRYKDALKTWYQSHSNRIGQDASVEAIEEDIKRQLEKKFEESERSKLDGEDEAIEIGEDDTYCVQLSESSDAEDPREGADMGRDFYWNPSDDSSADELEVEELQQIDPDDPVVDQESFQPDPVWNSTIDPQVGLWGTNHPHAPFPGSTLKWHSIVWDDGSTYEGLSRENIPHAYGTLVLGNAYAGNLVEPNVGRGVKYEGMFRAGAVEGLGQMSWPKGKVFRGEWVQGQKHGCGAMFDFSPMMKLVKEGKTTAEAWDATRDQIMGSVQKGTWNRDKFVSDPIDDIEAGRLGASARTTNRIDPKDLCDNALIQGVLEELDSVVQRSRMFQHKPDGEVALRYLQDGRGTPAPVQQDPLFYPHGTKWMAPGPVGQTYALPEDEGLKKHLTKVAENYYKVYKMYNLPWDEGNLVSGQGSDIKKAEAYWPEEFFQEGPNSAWWYKNVLYPTEKKVEEDIQFHTEKDQQEYRKKGKDALKRNWLERSKSMVEDFFNKDWQVKSKDDEKKFEMVKEFVKDCDEMGFMSSWKLTQSIQKASEERKKDIKRVQGSSKEKAFKKKELIYGIDELHKNFDSLSPAERREQGMALVQDITDYGFLKEFTKDGNVEVAAVEGGSSNDRMVSFPKLKSKDWKAEPTKRAPKRMLNPIMDPIDITKLAGPEKKRWQKVLDYLYNDLPEDDKVMETLLTKEELEKAKGVKFGGRAAAGRGGGAPTPPVASLSIGLTRFSFALNRQMSYLSKRATRLRNLNSL
ncbi:hypothetical protein HOP50_11g62610 [Chloropicon primus]|uniref:Uncharacterized protein n=2 Tax=Chloropicon primus TaxID=1764295 RepID=A0A5B8MTJ2_9CHLO|nr:hypothetical protein A3770_11p62390 [Chloropicon primus]UPR02934.1 hypothetical protein HOP50_11g62610 [Chloropicon primus]|eukprot:QDZ23721.1 hypothetical protein A3770_11p62390 [Chloropicon primus]